MPSRSIFLIFSILGYSFITVPANAQLLLKAKQVSVNAGRDAAAKEAELRRKLKEDEARAKEKIKEKLKEVEAKLKDEVEDLKQDLIDGKAVLQDALVCTVTNSLNNKEVSGSLRLEKGTLGEKALIRLADLFPEDPDKRNLAISFSGSIQDMQALRFELVDMHDGESIVRSGKFADLGLGDVKEKCGVSRNIVYLNNGNVVVNTQDKFPKVGSQVLKAAKKDVQEVVDSITAK